MTDAWRLIVSGAADGATNMAIDEALLRSANVPTLRFYRWTPACLSIGALQRYETAVSSSSGDAGTGWVRRISGGRALLHDDELTYSVVAPAGHQLVTGAVRESHARIAALLAEGLQRCGVPAEFEPAASRPRATAACYDVASDFEITVDGRKLVGSAQVRRTNAILQHGSIPFSFDASATTALLPLSAAERTDLTLVLQRRVIALRDITATPPTENDLIQSFVAVWRDHGMPVAPGELSESERQLAGELAHKYRSREWNEHRQLPPGSE